jgi:murein DD-endopeptidase MepM/ murein hydrolase activator NlpD
VSDPGLWQQILHAGLGWAVSVFPAAAPGADGPREFPVDAPADYASVHHDYPATDIFADCGSPAVAPVSGLVLEVGRVDRWDPRTDRGRDRGGKFVSLRGRDGVRYYSSHLARVERGLGRGSTVRAGQPIGRVGRSGSARPTPCHLHFGISPVCGAGGDWWIRRGTVPPYRYLRSWERSGRASPVVEVSAGIARSGCATRP